MSSLHCTYSCSLSTNRSIFFNLVVMAKLILLLLYSFLILYIFYDFIRLRFCWFYGIENVRFLTMRANRVCILFWSYWVLLRSVFLWTFLVYFWLLGCGIYNYFLCYFLMVLSSNLRFSLTGLLLCWRSVTVGIFFEGS